MDGLIQQKSLAEHIVEDLEQKIITRSLKPGQRIIEEALCKMFGVSRSPVREAFQILESRGFVVREPRKGISVAKITQREAEDIYLIRASLDGLATSLAVQRQTPQFLKRVKGMHAQMIRAAEKRNYVTYQNLNYRFHELIINTSENERLIQLIRNFDKQTMRYRLTVSNSPNWIANSTKIHAALIAAIEAGDAEEAERIRNKSILGQIRGFS
jgi:DNA-binding GntR family transcriptional regulator